MTWFPFANIAAALHYLLVQSSPKVEVWKLEKFVVRLRDVHNLISWRYQKQSKQLIPAAKPEKIIQESRNFGSTCPVFWWDHPLFGLFGWAMAAMISTNTAWWRLSALGLGFIASWAISTCPECRRYPADRVGPMFWVRQQKVGRWIIYKETSHRNMDRFLSMRKTLGTKSRNDALLFLPKCECDERQSLWALWFRDCCSPVATFFGQGLHAEQDGCVEALTRKWWATPSVELGRYFFLGRKLWRWWFRLEGIHLEISKTRRIGMFF